MNNENTIVDETLDVLLDEISDRLARGEIVDWADYQRRYPECAESLQQLLPAICTLGMLRDEAVADSGAAEALGKLGDYRILREVGRGGMGVVYEAEQISLSRRVALKILPFAAVLDPRHLQRFKNEAMAAAHLDHPHIVEVHGIGCERSIHFYAMRFIEGVTLADVVEAKRKSQEPQEAEQAVNFRTRGSDDECMKNAAAAADFSLPTKSIRFPNSAETSPALQAALSTVNGVSSKVRFRRVAEIGIQAAEALDHAHQMGIVHRDVKPSNLMLDERGKLWVTDFGLARNQGDASMTMTGDLVGTLRYMSPEQALAKRTTVDHRTDIYSLSATLYELLTLRAAFPENDREETLRQIAFDEPAPPRKFDKSIPEELETIILKAMEKNPDDRYATARELAEDLRRWVEHRPIVAKAPGAMLKAKKWARRHKNAVAAAAAAALVSVLCLVLSTVAVSAAWLNEREATRAARSERNEQVYRSYVADMQLGSREMEIGALSVATNCLESHRPSPGEKDLRNWEWYFLNSECHEEIAELPHTAAVNAVEYSPDGTLLATGGLDWTVRIWNADSRLVTAELPGCHAPVTSMSWSPNGKRLAACSGDGTVIIWNVESAQVERTTLPNGATSASAVDWSPNGQLLAAAIELHGVQGAVVVYDMNSNDDRSVSVDGSISNVAWTSDHRFIYTIGGAQAALRKAIVYDLDANQPIAEAPVDESLVLDVSPDGSRVALGGEAKRWRICDAATLKMTHEFDCTTVTAIRWHPLSTQIACGEVDGRVKLWDIESGQVTRTLAAHQMLVSRLAWSKDGQQLASASYDGSVKLWDVVQQHVGRRFPGGPAIDVDGAGRQLATASGGDICLFDLESGKLTSRLEAAVGGWPYTIAWRPDRRYVAVAFHTENEDDPDGAVFDVAARRIVQRIPGGRFVAWSPDGAKLAVSTRRNNIAPIVSRKSEQSHDVVVVEFLSGREIARLPGKPWQCSLAWSPDGKDLAVINTEMQVQVWDTTSWRTKWVLELHPEEPQLVSWSTADAVNWSPDGTRLAAVSSLGRLTVWSIPECKEIQRIHASSSPLSSVAWSPDGRRLATLSQDFRIWDSESGELLMSRRMPGWGLDWSRDGKRILLGGADGQSLCLDASIGYARER